MNLFAGENKTSARVTSLPQASNTSLGESPLVSSHPETNPGPTGLLRYDYRSPRQLLPGDRSAAEQSYNRGVQAQRARRAQEAIEAYRRAADLDPSYFEAYYNLGLVETETGNIPMALVAYESALAVRPESLDARYNFALGLKQTNYSLDAANELERILVIYPKESRCHLVLGNLYAQQLREPAKARLHYLKVLETDPRNPQAPAIRYWLADNPK